MSVLQIFYKINALDSRQRIRSMSGSVDERTERWLQGLHAEMSRCTPPRRDILRRRAVAELDGDHSWRGEAQMKLSVLGGHREEPNSQQFDAAVARLCVWLRSRREICVWQESDEELVVLQPKSNGLYWATSLSCPTTVDPVRVFTAEEKERFLRLATLRDFERFRVSAVGYLRDADYVLFELDEPEVQKDAAQECRPAPLSGEP